MRPVARFLSQLAGLVLLATLLPGATWAGQQRLYLWQIEGQDPPVYLFGTVHVCRSDCQPLPETVLSVFRQSRVLALELDPTAPQLQTLMLARAMYPETDSLDRHLTPEMMREVHTALSDLDIPAELLFRMKPWMASTTLAMLATVKSGYHLEQSIDLSLLREAKERGLKVVELETAEDQLGALESKTEIDDLVSLQHTVKMIKENRVRAHLDAMIEAWKQGDPDTLDALVRADLRADARSEKNLERMLTDRNPKMVAGIEALVGDKQGAFIAVGAAHLAGKGSIVDLLRARGYVLRQISADSTD